MGWITDICGRASRGQTWTATVIMLGHLGITELQKYRLLIGVDRTSLRIEHTILYHVVVVQHNTWGSRRKKIIIWKVS